MAEPLQIVRQGNQMRLTMNDGSIRMGDPVPGHAWLFGNTGVVAPPVIDPGGDLFMWPFPTEGVSAANKFKSESRPTHLGWDFNASSGAPPGAWIPAAADGVVIVARNYFGYGQTVILRHTLPGGKQVQTLYGHQIEGSISVVEGETVKRGKGLGQVGNTGRSFGAHLHFETWNGTSGGSQIDPGVAIPAWNAL